MCASFALLVRDRDQVSYSLEPHWIRRARITCHASWPPVPRIDVCECETGHRSSVARDPKAPRQTHRECKRGRLTTIENKVFRETASIRSSFDRLRTNGYSLDPLASHHLAVAGHSRFLFAPLIGMTCDRSRVSWHLVGTDLPRPLELHPIPLLNHQMPTAHDPSHVAQRLNVIRRVSIEQHQVCHLASLNRPNLVL